MSSAAVILVGVPPYDTRRKLKWMEQQPHLEREEGSPEKPENKRKRVDETPTGLGANSPIGVSD